MTNTPDTAPEAVEQLAKDHDEVGNNPDRYVMGHPHHWKTSATLRALSAALEAEKRKVQFILQERDETFAFMLTRAEAAEEERDEALNQLDSARHSVDVLEKRVDALKAELIVAIAQRDRARHQKETGA